MVKQVDKSSPSLMVACASGRHFPGAVLSARRTGTSQDFLTYTMRDVSISHYDTEGDDADELPVSLSRRSTSIPERLTFDGTI